MKGDATVECPGCKEKNIVPSKKPTHFEAVVLRFTCNKCESRSMMKIHEPRGHGDQFKVQVTLLGFTKSDKLDEILKEQEKPKATSKNPYDKVR